MPSLALRSLSLPLEMDNVVKDDGLGYGGASEDEGLGEGEAVEDTDDLGDDDAEDVIEDDDNLGDAEVDVADHCSSL